MKKESEQVGWSKIASQILLNEPEKLCNDLMHDGCVEKKECTLSFCGLTDSIDRCRKITVKKTTELIEGE